MERLIENCKAAYDKYPEEFTNRWRYKRIAKTFGVSEQIVEQAVEMIICGSVNVYLMVCSHFSSKETFCRFISDLSNI
jgi:hypothetical protein